MAARSLVVSMTISPWSRDVLFAMGALLRAVEAADEVLVTDEIRDAAAELRAVIERGDE